MLSGGDEFGRTQGGNNNAYCQDNPTSWYDWSLITANADLFEFTKSLTRLRNQHPVFRRPRFFQGRPLHGETIKDIGWFTPEGTEMDQGDWDDGVAKSIAVYLNGDAIGTVDARGEPVTDDTFLLLLNAWHEPITFTLPPPSWATTWETVVDTDRGEVDDAAAPVKARAGLIVAGRSIVLLRRLA
jgi:glycogen operon protein